MRDPLSTSSGSANDPGASGVAAARTLDGASARGDAVGAASGRSPIGASADRAATVVVTEWYEERTFRYALIASLVAHIAFVVCGPSLKTPTPPPRKAIEVRLILSLIHI